MNYNVTSVPFEITEVGQHFLLSNQTNYTVGVYKTEKATPTVIEQPLGFFTLPASWTGTVGVVRYPNYDKMWIDRIDKPQIPMGPGSSWAESVDIRVILENGEAHTIGTLTAPFQTGLLEGYFLPETSPLNRVKYIYLKSSDLNPVTSGLKVTVKGFSYTTGEVLNGFMVPIGDVEGEDRVYSRPTSVDWWGFTPCDLDVQYLAPANPPAVCETEAEVSSIAESYDSLVSQMASQNPSLPEIPSAPDVEKPSEWTGGESIDEPTANPDCVCSASYGYIAKAIDARGAEIAGEIRGFRREFFDFMTAINDMMSTGLEQTDATSKRYSDQVKDLLKKINDSLYVTDAEGRKLAFVDLVMNLVNMMSLRI